MVVLALIYVCALNVMIVHTLYDRFVRSSITQQQLTLMRDAGGEGRRMRFARTRVFNHTAHAPADTLYSSSAGCPYHQNAVVITATSQEGSNDATAHMPVLYQLRQSFRVTEQPPRYVFLMVSASAFVSFHRAWCNSLFEQSKRRVICELVLLPEKSELPNAFLKRVFTEVMQRQECVGDVILLPDNVHISTHFFGGVNSLPKSKVSCLALTHNRVCSLPAYFLPRRFVQHYNEEIQFIEKTARDWRMFHGNKILVHKQD